MKKSSEVLVGAIISASISLTYGAVMFYLANSYFGFDLTPPTELKEITRSFGSTIAQISITLAGFILTSTAIFTAFSDKPLVQAMYISGHANALISRMYIAMGLDLTTGVLAVIVSIRQTTSPLLFAVLIGLSSSCLISLISVMHKLWFVLNYIGKPKKETNQETFEEIDLSDKPISQIK